MSNLKDISIKEAFKNANEKQNRILKHNVNYILRKRLYVFFYCLYLLRKNFCIQRKIIKIPWGMRRIAILSSSSEYENPN